MNFDVHLLGFWLAIMIVHSLIVEQFGEAFVSFPMYLGLVITVILVVRRKWSALPMEILMVFLCLLVLMLLSGINGIDPEHSNYTTKLYLKGMLLAVLVGGVIKNVSQIKIISLYCLSGMIFGVYEAYRQYFTGEFAVNKAEIGVQRVAGLRGDPNDTALLLLAGIPLALYWLAHVKSRYGKLFFILLLISIIGAIALTGSRGGFVSLLLILLLMFFKKPSFNGVFIGALILSVGLLFAPSSYFERMGTLITGEKGRTSLSKRSAFVVNGLKIISNNPLLGVGPGNFGEANERINTGVIIKKRGEEHAAHNMYLQFFVENGVIAGVLFLILLSYPLLSLIKFDKDNKAEFSAYGLGFCMATSLFAMLFAGLFLSQAKSSVLWFFVGIGMASSIVNKSNRINTS